MPKARRINDLFHEATKEHHDGNVDKFLDLYKKIQKKGEKRKDKDKIDNTQYHHIMKELNIMKQSFTKDTNELQNTIINNQLDDLKNRTEIRNLQGRIKELRKQLRNIDRNSGSQRDRTIKQIQSLLEDARTTLKRNEKYQRKLDKGRFKEDIRTPEDMKNMLNRIEEQLDLAAGVGSKALTDTSPDHNRNSNERNNKNNNRSGRNRTGHYPETNNSYTSYRPQTGLGWLKNKAAGYATPQNRRKTNTALDTISFAAGIGGTIATVMGVRNIIFGDEKKTKKGWKQFGIGSLFLGGNRLLNGYDRSKAPEIPRKNNGEDNENTAETQEESEELTNTAKALGVAFQGMQYREFQNTFSYSNNKITSINRTKLQDMAIGKNKAERGAVIAQIEALKNNENHQKAINLLGKMGVDKNYINNNSNKTFDQSWETYTKNTGQETDESNQNNESGNETPVNNTPPLNPTIDNDQDPLNESLIKKDKYSFLPQIKSLPNITHNQAVKIIDTGTRLRDLYPSSKLHFVIKNGALYPISYNNPQSLPINLNTLTLSGFNTETNGIKFTSIDDLVRSANLVNYLRAIMGGKAKQDEPWDKGSRFELGDRGDIVFEHQNRSQRVNKIKSGSIGRITQQDILDDDTLEDNYTTIDNNKDNFVSFLNKLSRRKDTKNNIDIQQNADTAIQATQELATEIKTLYDINIVDISELGLKEQANQRSDMTFEYPTREEVRKMGNMLKQQLAKYPSGFFQKVKIPHIVIAKSLNGENSGLGGVTYVEDMTGKTNHMILNTERLSKSQLGENLAKTAINHEIHHAVHGELINTTLKSERNAIVGSNYYQSNRTEYKSPRHSLYNIETGSKKKSGALDNYSLSGREEDFCQVAAGVMVGGQYTKDTYTIAKNDNLVQQKIDLYRETMKAHFPGIVFPTGNEVSPEPTPPAPPPHIETHLSTNLKFNSVMDKKLPKGMSYFDIQDLQRTITVGSRTEKVPRPTTARYIKLDPNKTKIKRLASENTIDKNYFPDNHTGNKHHADFQKVESTFSHTGMTFAGALSYLDGTTEDRRNIKGKAFRNGKEISPRGYDDSNRPKTETRLNQAIVIINQQGKLQCSHKAEIGDLVAQYTPTMGRAQIRTIKNLTTPEEQREYIIKEEKLNVFQAPSAIRNNNGNLSLNNPTTYHRFMVQENDKSIGIAEIDFGSQSPTPRAVSLALKKQIPQADRVVYMDTGQVKGGSAGYGRVAKSDRGFSNIVTISGEA